MSSQVNRPTNVKAKEGDVNRKLQFYGIFAAFQAGKVPSVSQFTYQKIAIADVSQNEQIDIALNSFLKSKALANPSQTLSVEGRALVADFRDGT
jgi:hypothetical protein